jgi:rare lipoprotein A
VLPNKPLFAGLFLAALAVPACAGGWATVHLYVHKTGRCGIAREVLASFYGTGLQTANGERFNPYGITAASYDYGLGTTITVTNPHNGRTCHVRVNDHGPNGLARDMGARIDFALGARECLGMVASQYVCAPAAHFAAADFHEKKSAAHVHKKQRKHHAHTKHRWKKRLKHNRPPLKHKKPALLVTRAGGQSMALRYLNSSRSVPSPLRLPAPDLDLYVDVAARRVRIGADFLVGFLGERRELGLRQARIFDPELHGNSETAAVARAD